MGQSTQLGFGVPQSHHHRATYERRRPELTTLHQVVRENYKTFAAHVENEGRHLPKHVTKEFDEYLKCGILAHGFLRLKCEDCKAERLVAFSCRGRGFCPSCLGKRQAIATEFLIEKLLGGLPVRQFVLSMPFELRFLMARDSKFMSLILAIVNRSITRLYRQKAKAELGIDADYTTGAVTFIQRYGSSLNLNIHFHILVIEGVWNKADAKTLAHNPESKTKLRPLDPPTNDDIKDLTVKLSQKIKRFLEKKGYSKPTSGNDKDIVYEQEGFFTDGAVIDEFQSASIQSRLATGPNRGKRVRKLGQQVHLPFRQELKGPRCFAVDGYSLHANTFCQAIESHKLKRLIEYVARPPFANERITRTHQGDVCLKLKKPFSDGTTHIVFTPLEFIEKLSALVPKPRVHLIRYAGAFARHAKIRPDVLVKARMGEAATQVMPSDEPKAPNEKSKSWARLLRKVFGIDVESCHACGGKNVKIVAAIMTKSVIEKILNHIGLPPDIPEVTEARAPPQASFEW